LEQGPNEKTIIEQCIRNRMPLPAAIANAPELELGLDLFYLAFMDLTTCRSMGFGEGPVPWSAVRDYCNELELEGDQREDMFAHIRLMDTAYLSYRAAKTKAAKREEKSAKTTTKVNPR
jgi:hypothetical protein